MTRSALLCVSMPLALALALGCGKPPRPPHPPPDPHLDIVLEGHTLHINGHELDVRNTTSSEIIEGVGSSPGTRDEFGHRWRQLGLILSFKDRRISKIKIMFQPYGLRRDEGVKSFKGRFIVNGAWIHPSMRFFDFQEELGYPCNRGNQGVGKFARSPFANSWACDVGGTNVTYWMKYWSNETPPLAAFDVELHDKQHPPQEPKPPPLEDSLEPWLEGIYESAKDSMLDALKSVFG